MTIDQGEFDSMVKGLNNEQSGDAYAATAEFYSRGNRKYLTPPSQSVITGYMQYLMNDLRMTSKEAAGFIQRNGCPRSGF